MPARFAARGDPHAGMDAAAGSLEPLLELAARDEAAGLGRCALAAALPEDGGRGAARRAVARAAGAAGAAGKRAAARAHAARDRRELTRQGRLRWPASSAGSSATRTPPATWRSTTCWSTPCAAARRPGRASASTCATCPRRYARPQETPDPDDDPTRAWREAVRKAQGIARERCRSQGLPSPRPPASGRGRRSGPLAPRSGERVRERGPAATFSSRGCRFGGRSFVVTVKEAPPMTTDTDDRRRHRIDPRSPRPAATASGDSCANRCAARATTSRRCRWAGRSCCSPSRWCSRW